MGNVLKKRNCKSGKQAKRCHKMKASQAIDSELKRNRPTDPGKEIVLSATQDAISVRVHLSDWDRLAVSLAGLTVNANAVGETEGEKAFISRCHRLADRISYLEEPQKAIEIDGSRLIGIIRSHPPSPRFNSISYFEIILNGNEKSISLARKVRFGSSGKDMSDKAVIGQHLLTRLIDDLCENITQKSILEK